MKYILLFALLTSNIVLAFGQKNTSEPSIIIKTKQKKTAVSIDDSGQLILEITRKDARKIKNKKFVQYSDFGAKGDGKTDDILAISATHAWANQEKLPVKADPGFTYYIGKKAHPINIKTNTDFSDAQFIIDDREVEDRRKSIFIVSSNHQSYKVSSIKTLRKNQKSIDLQLQGPSLITVTNRKVKHYIRYGLNQDNGSAQTDIFVVDKDGQIDMNAPIIWDFDHISEMKVLPMDEEILTLKGGHFTTIANQAESKYTYYSRNIAIRRSNVVVDGLEHHITGEGDTGAPYGGFLNISDCSYITVKNTILTGHKTYKTIGSAGKPVSMGSYDISASRALNISFINCRQTNDVDDGRYWGIIGSNYCKNILYDGCTFSRFDAHKGVANASIRNSTLGHMGINAIGSGTFLVENSTIRGRTLINLRSDYGSTWQGEFIIRDCKFIPGGGHRPMNPTLFGGSNSGKHDFGYTCYMPENITIENLYIEDTNTPENYKGPVIFSNFNKERIDDSYSESFPYIITKKVTVKNVSTASGNKLRKSDNPYMFNGVEIVQE
ncbi:hypothetical protein [Membranihabitans marinus]|uniref:hypothetical protein n=1 Tax=Membranihabitans marinus TaxID=1227546 RepID=UPI001F256848|nr:hypothetical protein [Membranihabitans marinus]